MLFGWKGSTIGGKVLRDVLRTENNLHVLKGKFILIIE